MVTMREDQWDSSSNVLRKLMLFVSAGEALKLNLATGVDH